MAVNSGRTPKSAYRSIMVPRREQIILIPVFFSDLRLKRMQIKNKKKKGRI